MAVRISSKQAFQKHEATTAPTKRSHIIGYLNANGLSSRRELAHSLDYDTATVSGLVTPMLKAGVLSETIGRHKCPITGHLVFKVRLRRKYI